MSDGELVNLALAGRGEALHELVRRWAGRVTALCHARIGCHAAADDLAQEALLRGVRSLGSLTERERFGPWICAIARHLCLNWLRDRRRSQPLQEQRTSAPSAAELLEREEEHSRLRAEVARLPRRYRETLRLFYHDDLTYQQMAELLGITPAAVNARLTRARQMLRQRLEPARR